MFFLVASGGIRAQMAMAAFRGVKAQVRGLIEILGCFFIHTPE